MVQVINPMIKNRLIKLLFGYDWEIVEILGAFFKIAWGVQLLLPVSGTGTKSFQIIPNYQLIASGLIVIGLIHFYIIFSNKLEARRWITLFAVAFWIFTVVFIYLKTGIPSLTLIVIAGFMTINFWRLGIAVRNERRNKNVGPPVTTGERRFV